MPHTAAPVSPDQNDPYLWLEAVDSDEALAWVRAQNALTEKALTEGHDFVALRQDLLAVLDAQDRIPSVTRRGEWFYNLWQDAAHPRGLWRRTPLASYTAPEPSWETVLDLDALGAAEGENWVWAGATSLPPTHQRCLVSLSRGGADAHVVREFDTVSKQFVAGGFNLPEAKSSTDWIDADTLYVATDFGPGSMTESGYARIVKRWARGTPLSAAVTVFEGEADDVWAGVSVDDTPGFERTFFVRALDFYRKRTWLQQPDGALTLLDVPDDADVDFFRDTLLLQLRSDWAPAGITYPAGALLACDATAYLAGERGEHSLQVVFAPTATRSLAGMDTTRDHLLLSVLDQVVGQMEVWRKQGSRFSGGVVPAPGPGTLGLGALHDPHTPDDPWAEAYFLSYTDFLTPDSLALCDTAQPVPTLDDKAAWIKSRRPQFDARGMQVSQHHARSADGTAVPYFVVTPPHSGLPEPRATLLYGYGGFEVSLEPWYSGTQGRAWTSRGGVWVVANLRGGGEFGPAWHQAATGAGKQRCFDDFYAVAEDLIARGITTPQQLGIMGGSNGGLLVGAAFTQRPDLFGAVVCQVPLLDMKRYHLLLAGASWMAEYGDPDVAEDWAAIQRYSPYQNLHPGRRYPKVLFTTSTRDDRVHPAHARKMAARMLEQGHPLLYWENTEGGHGGAADNAQRAHLQALEFSYLWQQLGPAGG